MDGILASLLDSLDGTGWYRMASDPSLDSPLDGTGWCGWCWMVLDGFACAAAEIGCRNRMQGWESVC